MSKSGSITKRGDSELGWPETIIIGIVVVLVLFQILDVLSGLIFGIILATIAGMIAGQVLRGRPYSFLMSLGLGFCGGLVGNILLGVIGFGGLADIPLLGNILAGVIGAVVLVFGMRAVKDGDFGR